MGVSDYIVFIQNIQHDHFEKWLTYKQLYPILIGTQPIVQEVIALSQLINWREHTKA